MYTKKWVKSCPFTRVSPFLSASSNHLFAISALRLFSMCLYLAPIRRAQIPGGAILSLKSGSLALAKSFPHNNLRTLALSCRSFFNPDPLFSITCGLFSQNTRGCGGQHRLFTQPKHDEMTPASVSAAQPITHAPKPSGSCYNFRSPW